MGRYYVTVLDSGSKRWGYLSSIRDDDVVLSEQLSDAMHFDTELDAKVAGQYIPQDAQWQVQEG